MKKVFLFIAALAMSTMTWAATGDLLCGGSFIGSFPNSESWTGSDVDYYSGHGYKFDTDETLQSPNLTAGVKKVKIRILVGHNGGATSTLTVGAFDSEGSQLSISENIVPTVAYNAQTDDAIQEFTLDGDGVSDIKYVLISFTKVKNYGMKTFEVYDATGTATVTLDSIVIRGKATKMEYKVGEAFDTDGLEVWGIYTKIEKHDSISQIKSSGITWSIDPETFEEVSDNASVTLVASYKELTTADTTITGINVTEKPAPVGGNTIVMEDYQEISFTTSDGAYTVVAAKAGAGNDPIYNATGKDLRIYAKGTFTLTSNNGNMTQIAFNISAQGKKRQAEITPSVGTMAYDMGNAVVTWTGNAAEVVFTVGETAIYGSESSKAGQFDFESIEITKGSTPTGIREAMVNANVRKAMVNGRLIIVKGEKAFDLQGRIVK